MANRKLIKTIPFPVHSKPHMLRVSPDGKEVWVQTADAHTNVVLHADDLSVLSTEQTGKYPVTNAWTPDRRYSIVTNRPHTFGQVFASRTVQEVERLDIRQGGSDSCVSQEGQTALNAHAGADAEAVHG